MEAMGALSRSNAQAHLVSVPNCLEWVFYAVPSKNCFANLVKKQVFEVFDIDWDRGIATLQDQVRGMVAEDLGKVPYRGALFCLSKQLNFELVGVREDISRD